MVNFHHSRLIFLFLIIYCLFFSEIFSSTRFRKKEKQQVRFLKFWGLGWKKFVQEIMHSVAIHSVNRSKHALQIWVGIKNRAMLRDFSHADGFFKKIFKGVILSGCFLKISWKKNWYRLYEKKRNSFTESTEIRRNIDDAIGL